MNRNNIYTVNRKQLLANYQHIRQHVSHAKICAMVKANAYGVGVEYVIPVLKGHVDYYGVSCVGEAKEVRKIDKVTPIIVLGKTEKTELNWCSKNHVVITISNLFEWQQCVNSNLSLVVHIKIDTGMHRYGLSSVSDVKYIIDHKPDHITIEGILTHFATKQKDVPYLLQQYNDFQCFTALMDKDVLAHCASSYATLHQPQCVLDMVRVGYSLYNGLASCVSIRSRIIEVQEIEKGQSVGYDRTYIAKTKQRIGIVPIGYADGMDRRLSNKGYVYLNGHYAKIVGNICMDAMFVLLDECDHLGDSVEILGKHIRYEDYADILKTSPYDVMLKWRYRRMKIMLK